MIFVCLFFSKAGKRKQVKQFFKDTASSAHPVVSCYNYYNFIALIVPLIYVSYPHAQAVYRLSLFTPSNLK